MSTPGGERPAGDAEAVLGVASGEKSFHGWRLLGALSLVMVVVAAVCAVVDLLVIPR